MRAIILLAIFAFAASAIVDSTSYQQGFAKELGLNGAQANNSAQCQAAVAAAFTTADKIVFAKAPEEYALHIVTLYTQLKNETVKECAAYIQDLVTLAFGENQSTEDLQAFVQFNLQRYSLQIIQLGTQWVDAILAGDYSLAGQKDGQIFNILFGLKTPETLPILELNETNIVPFNQSKFIKETYGTYLTKIGMEAADVDLTVQCLDTLSSAPESLNAAFGSVATRPTIEEQLQATKPVYANFIKAAIPCIKAATQVAQFVQQEAQIFAYAPTFVIVTIVHNIGLNLPEIQQGLTNQQINTFRGEYTQAGETLAGVHKTIFNGAFQL